MFHLPDVFSGKCIDLIHKMIAYRATATSWIRTHANGSCCLPQPPEGVKVHTPLEDLVFHEEPSNTNSLSGDSKLPQSIAASVL